MAASHSTRIKPLPLMGVVRLHRLFVDAVHTSFTYFDQDIQQRTIRNHRPLKLLLARLHPRRIVLTAWSETDLIGYAIGSVPRGGEGQLYWLYVAPSHRGGNTGLALLSRMLRSQHKLGAATVTLATYDHRRYYERQGFKYMATKPIDGIAMDIMSYRVAA
jgi:GNAT superfamily N-acetyltransferase